jgi:Fe-S cluster assembly protein SufD
MDETAKISLIPKLEINNDDVICAHGAASGKPDESVIFYLKSRGITHTDAEKIYVQGFLGEFLDKISNSEMQEKAMKYISTHC